MTADYELTLFDDVPGTPEPEMGSTFPGTPCLPGQSIPRNGQLIPRAGTERPYAFDWSITRGVTAIDPRGYTWHCATLRELIRDIPRGSTLVGESTFESYDLREREQILEFAESRDIRFLTVPARGNTRRRSAAGLTEKTSQSKRTDREDALAIQLAAVSGAHLKKPAIVSPEWAALRDEAARRFVRLRYSGQKESYALAAARCLPPFMQQPVERRIALGQNGTWNLIIIAAVAVAAEFVSDRQGFERLTGLYAHGYPSQFRSDLMHWGWNRQARKRERITLAVYRRELRWLFNQLRGDTG